MTTSAKATESERLAFPEAWWSCDIAELLRSLESNEGGLGSAEASRRAAGCTKQGKARGTLRLFVSQFTSPLVLILIVAALLSFMLREWLDATIILAIVAGSGVLGFTQEHAASKAVQDLQLRLVQRVRLLRDGSATSLTVGDVVPGDVVVLKAGDLVPGDGRILTSAGLLVDEAVLTGEAFPVEKSRERALPTAGLAQRPGALFQGTSIRSGTCSMLVVTTGKDTVFGGIQQDLEKIEGATEFTRGLAGFGTMLMRVMLVVVGIVLLASMLLGRDLMTSVLFAMALAVALSPELLPAIVSVTLAQGAQRMTHHGVLIRRLQAIENLGGMDILCTDKTGTLTTGSIALSAVVAVDGTSSPENLRLAAINAQLQTGMQSALDDAILAAASAADVLTEGAAKLREVPYDFASRRFSVEARFPAGSTVLITKGAVKEVISGCASVRVAGGVFPLDAEGREAADAFVREKGDAEFRVLALSTGEWGNACLEGYLLFSDPPKRGIEKVVGDMLQRGVSVRIISGDNRHVSAHLATLIGLESGEVLTGDMIATFDDAALTERVRKVQVFAEIEPQQKERIVRAFQAAGHAVGYMGDGINDAPALRASDIGISVDTAVDVARESADIVLLRPDLGAILGGIEDGRRTFANTLKYVAITISANFGNMVSMALATVLLPFLPLLPSQILLNNLLSDLPAVAIATDTVDKERVASAQRWDITRIRNFMLIFGLLSTVFDLMTFALLHFVLHADPVTFRTSWFMLSLLTEVAALLVLRTRRHFWRSIPSQPLLWSSAAVAVLAICLPYSGGIAALFAFRPLALPLLGMIIALAVAYALVTETAKRLNYSRAR